MFSRIAIVNRGEAAMRLIHAVRDLNAEAAGGHRIEVVALHTEGERSAMFVREADIAYNIGPAADRPYLDHDKLEEALRATGSDAAWVGWGFVAEDAGFAQRCRDIGVTFIGPSPEAMRRLGDKIGSKLLAEEVGVPVAPWSRGGVDTVEDALARAAEIGYPLMLKATAGGGGRGIRLVATDAELTDAYDRTRDEAFRAFGSGVVFLEKLVTGARHVEVQVIADGHGAAWAIGVRDCTVQRRNQKVIEESASPLLSVEQTQELKASAERLALAVGYCGAGTVEFLYHPGERFFAFLEVNTRLQVEHPITEITTGTDLVKLQIHVAGGGRLEGDRPVERGHAVEARLNAEDPDRDFAPAPGRIALLDLPSGPGIRVDTGVGEGDSIPADFDSMIAKIIAYGSDRAEALARLRRAMAETTVVIDGGATNKSFVLELLDQPEITGSARAEAPRVDGDEAPVCGEGSLTAGLPGVDGGGPRAFRGSTGAEPPSVRAFRGSTGAEPPSVAKRVSPRAFQGPTGAEPPSVRQPLVCADTGWIDRVRAQGRLIADEHSGIALAVAGIESYEEAEAIERARLLVTAHGGRPQVQHDVGRAIDLKLRGAAYRVTVLRTGPHRYRVSVASPTESGRVDVDFERITAHRARLTAGSRSHRLVTANHGPVMFVEVDGVAHRISRDEGGVIRSQAPALVVATPVAVGSEVAAGAPVVVLESMKMETVIPAPFAATVKELLVSAGSQVETGAPLLRLEPLGDGTPEGPVAAAARLDLPSAESPAGPADVVRDAQRDLSAMLLGYDLDLDANAATLDGFLVARDDLAAQGDPPIGAEIAMLDVFADFAELSRNRPAEEIEHAETRIHSPREYFHTYLMTLDPDRGGLPTEFRDRLTRVLENYGIDSLERTPSLEAALFRVFLAQQRSAPEIRLATALLQRWSQEPTPGEPHAAAANDVLERLIIATQRRFPAVGDLARSVHFRWFDQPLVDADRSAVLSAVGPELDALASVPEGPERERRLEALADIPERIVSFLAARLEGGLPASEPMLAVLIRRHYREWELTGLREYAVAGHPFAAADYTLDDRPTHLVSTEGEFGELRPGSGLTRALAAETAATAPGRQAVADIYLLWPGVPRDPQEASRALSEALRQLPFVHRLRRIAVGVAPGGGAEVRYFTLRPDGRGGLEEDLPVRDVHPMVGRRLDLWRLREFDLTRLDAPADVLLLHCVAKGNPADQRLVALAQVRQLAVVRAAGRITALPHVERALANCLEAIRRARVERGPDGARLDMNHVWVNVWPPIEADLDQLTGLRAKIAPMTAGAGIEEVRVAGSVIDPDGGAAVPIVARFAYQPGSGVVFGIEPPATERLHPLDAYAEKVVRARRRGVVYPYELHDLVAGEGGTAVEHDLDEEGRLVPVDRPYGENTAGIICAVVSTPSAVHPEGITRVLLAGDPLRSLGSVAQAECARVIAALDLAEEMKVPVEWFAVSAGARISMDSGTENMDWVARALKRIIEFTQAGHEINVVVAGINVGAQPYWNAEATMLMHTKGILVMTPDSAMVLTGKQSLDFSGGVSAEDNFGIGGYDRVMGPNGQAQYWAADLAGAVDVLLAHYEHTYVQPGESGPRRVRTTDPADRDVTTYPHVLEGSDFTTVGDIFSAATNPDRKKAFDIRTVMRALVDQDLPMSERWVAMADADTAVVVDAHVGGHSVCLLGIESRPVARRGFPPADGPDTYTAGTLFPRSSKKAARAINAASGNRPLVVLANLSGFDGSPESMRNLQLEYGAEIGRAIVNFAGPIVFVVVSRYHGGAFVVFSKALNPRMTVLAIEGSFASVIGGAPAAAVVFSRDVDARTAADPRVLAIADASARAEDGAKATLLADLAEVRTTVRAEKLGEVAAHFDAIHSIHRAVRVGSVDEVIAPDELRPRIIAAIEAG